MNIFKSKNEKELELMFGMWYNKLFVLSNLDKKGFVEFMKYHIKEYDK